MTATPPPLREARTTDWTFHERTDYNHGPCPALHGGACWCGLEDLVQREVERASAEITVLQERVAALEAALARYGKHRHECDLNKNPDFGECSCGWSAIFLPIARALLAAAGSSASEAEPVTDSPVTREPSEG